MNTRLQNLVIISKASHNILLSVIVQYSWPPFCTRDCAQNVTRSKFSTWCLFYNLLQWEKILKLSHKAKGKPRQLSSLTSILTLFRNWSMPLASNYWKKKTRWKLSISLTSVWYLCLVTWTIKSTFSQKVVIIRNYLCMAIPFCCICSAESSQYPKIGSLYWLV